MALSLSSMTAMLSAIHMQLAAVNSEKQMTLVKEKKKKSSISKNVYNKHYTWSAIVHPHTCIRKLILVQLLKH